jgi:hypothetical protein
MLGTASGRRQANSVLEWRKRMIRRKRALGTLALAATVIFQFIRPAGAQDFGERSQRPSGPPPESHPKADEKAYKAALDRIPTPNKKYDPWGNARPSDSPNPGKKSN